jgi:phospholipase C
MSSSSFLAQARQNVAVGASLFALLVNLYATEENPRDSGYIQPVDFFGDGTRIRLLIVSPFSEGGHISHRYSDHVSIIKFIERNFGLKPLTARSRDNLPNPKTAKNNPYVPLNTPAIDDLFSAFKF